MTIGGSAALMVPSSGIVTWKSTSTSSRKASNASSVRSSSSISSTGGAGRSGSSACSSGRLIRKRSEKMSCSSRVAVELACGFGQPDRDHLRGVVPLVDGGGDVEALVALQPDQPAARASAASTLAISVLPTPASPSRNSGRPMLQRQEQHRRQVALGDIAGASAAGRGSSIGGGQLRSSMHSCTK